MEISELTVPHDTARFGLATGADLAEALRRLADQLESGEVIMTGARQTDQVGREDFWERKLIICYVGGAGAPSIAHSRQRSSAVTG
jgi:hypothetical protein